MSKMYKRLYGGGGGGEGGYVCVPQAVNEVEERHFHRNGYRKGTSGGGGGGPDKQSTPVEMN